MTEDAWRFRSFGNLIVEYSQDYFDDYDDELLAFQSFIEGGSRARTEGALAELDRILTTCQAEPELEETLERRGLAVIMEGGEAPYRDFLMRLRGWLVESLEDRPLTPNPEPRQ